GEVQRTPDVPDDVLTAGVEHRRLEVVADAELECAAAGAVEAVDREIGVIDQGDLVGAGPEMGELRPGRGLDLRDHVVLRVDHGHAIAAGDHELVGRPGYE